LLGGEEKVPVGTDCEVSAVFGLQPAAGAALGVVEGIKVVDIKAGRGQGPHEGIARGRKKVVRAAEAELIEISKSVYKRRCLSWQSLMLIILRAKYGLYGVMPLILTFQT
jgi:hypothetical protein